jgi:hypothetical protein
VKALDSGLILRETPGLLKQVAQKEDEPSENGLTTLRDPIGLISQETDKVGARVRPTRLKPTRTGQPIPT